MKNISLKGNDANTGTSGQQKQTGWVLNGHRDTKGADGVAASAYNRGENTVGSTKSGELVWIKNLAEPGPNDTLSTLKHRFNGGDRSVLRKQNGDFLIVGSESDGTKGYAVTGTKTGPEKRFKRQLTYREPIGSVVLADRTHITKNGDGIIANSQEHLPDLFTDENGRTYRKIEGYTPSISVSDTQVMYEDISGFLNSFREDFSKSQPKNKYTGGDWGDRW